MWDFILMMAVVFSIFYFILIRPEKRKRQQHEEKIRSLKKGDKIITTGGAYGVIEEVKTNTVTVKIAENVRVKFGKSYIATVRQEDD